MFSGTFARLVKRPVVGLMKNGTQTRNLGEVPVITGERSVNKVTLIGRVGRDPEVRGSQSRPVTMFSLATSVTLRSPDGTYRQITDWHRISVFRTNLQQWSANTINKGDKVYVTGSVRYGKYVDQETSEVNRSVTIIADDVALLAKRLVDPVNEAEEREDPEPIDEAM